MELQKNLKFQCQSDCPGKCCKAPQGKQMFVFLTKADRFRIAGFLKKRIHTFAQELIFENTRFTNRRSRVWFLRLSGKESCRFLKNGKCEIYSVRPVQCRTWPYWPENMTEEIFKSLSEECPGIGKGDVNADYIEKQLSDQRMADAIYSNQRG